MFERMSRAVQMTMIVCGAVVVTVLIGTIGWLVYMGRDTAAIMALVGAVVTPALMAMLYGKTANVERQTNGQMHRMMNLVERATGNSPPEPGKDGQQSPVDTLQ